MSQTLPPTPSESEVIAVVDTNVLIDIFSCRDLSETYDKLGESGVDSERATYRRARARESLLLAIYFDMTKSVTMSLNGEAWDTLTTLVPTNPSDSFEWHYTMIFAGLVQPFVLSRWRVGQAESRIPVSGNRADSWLLDYAKTKGLPLITNEGYTQNGLELERLRKRAKEQDVSVLIPREFYEGKIDERVAAIRFLDRFRESAPSFLESQSMPEIAAESVRYVEAYFRHVLLGETAGRSAPVSTSLV